MKLLIKHKIFILQSCQNKLTNNYKNKRKHTIGIRDVLWHFIKQGLRRNRWYIQIRLIQVQLN